VAANPPQTKPVDLGCESADYWQLSSTSTIAIIQAVATSTYRVPLSVSAKGDFRHFYQSSTNPANFVKIDSVDVEIIGLIEMIKKQ